MTHQISTKTYAKNLILKKSKILRFPGTTVPESTDSPICRHDMISMYESMYLSICVSHFTSIWPLVY